MIPATAAARGVRSGLPACSGPIGAAGSGMAAGLGWPGWLSGTSAVQGLLEVHLTPTFSRASKGSHSPPSQPPPHPTRDG